MELTVALIDTDAEIRNAIQSYCKLLGVYQSPFNPHDHRSSRNLGYDLSNFLDRLKRMEMIEHYTVKADSEVNTPITLKEYNKAYIEVITKNLTNINIEVSYTSTKVIITCNI